MAYYAGIDLGTTNSAIATWDGSALKLWKSPEQNDVTPSAIYFDRRGRYVGKRAYDLVPQDRSKSATLFKRLMGTTTPINISGQDSVTPEWCSAEILKTLFAYLPEEVRSQVQGTVITVPAAFNQMQKDATLQAAEMAGIGAVTLMQEPVAAVMSVMRARSSNGTFIIYDLGGGTLDVAIAEGLNGRVSLQAHGGIEMCGGRDWDRAIVANIVRPWLERTFDLPEDAPTNPAYRKLFAKLDMASEKAKIELSSRGEAVILLSEVEIGLQDQNGAEIYLDIPLGKEQLDQLIEDKLKDSIESVRETMSKAHLSSQDVDRVVFVGGPTQYKTVRDKVAFELGLPGALDVNPMTAVAEGAAIFAESVDWGSQRKGRKATRGSVSAGSALAISFNYIARTPDIKSKLVVKAQGTVAAGSEFQVDSLETGWSSGRQTLKDGASVELTLSRLGENEFKVFVFDPSGSPIALENDRITIARTAAAIDSIPASHSIGIASLEKAGGQPVMSWLVRAGDPLPKKGTMNFLAGEAIKAGSQNSLDFKIWEGEIASPVMDNRWVGSLRIPGSELEQGVIAKGAELICEYEVSDSGNVMLEVTVPSVGGSFKTGHNLYSRQESGIDYSAVGQQVHEEAERQLSRLDEIAEKIDDPQIDRAREKLDQALAASTDDGNPEQSKEAMDRVQDAKKLIAKIRDANLKTIRQMELDSVVEFFDNYVREHAKPSEETQFDNAVRSAKRAIDNNDSSFENYLSDLCGKNWDILWRQDSFVIQRFQWLSKSPHLFTDKAQFRQLVGIGQKAAEDDDMHKLREAVLLMDSIRIHIGGDDGMSEGANIIVA
ncbi:Hsp70 family protein [Pseudoxanthomonas kaohsiungensis]|uniref:Hsp70 family protein n=1 Tax=Pseudoxanthomonas kaohsiungensis TaxID=283923 RepID=A0ABW3LYD2_9GAMM|nr:Hsp70 family protein [Pseudoxanthomonas kaohsiungensis]KAF1701165.1 heat-shock protein Hsp70 [Pseudoxanthomonas kaohsiungensis]